MLTSKIVQHVPCKPLISQPINSPENRTAERTLGLKMSTTTVSTLPGSVRAWRKFIKSTRASPVTSGHGGGFHAVDPKSSKWFIVIDLFWKGCQPPDFWVGKIMYVQGKLCFRSLVFICFHASSNTWSLSHENAVTFPSPLISWQNENVVESISCGKSWKIMENPHLFLTFDHF